MPRHTYCIYFLLCHSRKSNRAQLDFRESIRLITFHPVFRHSLFQRLPLFAPPHHLCYTQNMKTLQATIIEIQQSAHSQTETQPRTAMLRLASSVHIHPGQYLQACLLKEKDQPIGTNLYPGGFASLEASENILTTAPPVPEHWQPGDRLRLYGPLGKGFNLPQNASRVALIALGESSDHLLPLAHTAIQQNAEIALFTDGGFPKLPPNIEVSPMAALEEAANWADYTALSGSWEEIQAAKQNNALKNIRGEAEVLTLVPMPCSGLADCGICTITDRNGKKHLACEDGPVFNWRQL